MYHTNLKYEYKILVGKLIIHEAINKYNHPIL